MQGELVSSAVVGILVCCVSWLCDSVGCFDDVLLQTRKNVVFTRGCYQPLYLVMGIEGKSVQSPLVFQNLAEQNEVTPEEKSFPRPP